MALPSSGTIKMSDIRNEYGTPFISFQSGQDGDSNPIFSSMDYIGLSLYYRGLVGQNSEDLIVKERVPNSSDNSAIPTSGTIRLSNFRGSSNYNITLTIVQSTPETGSGGNNNGSIIFKLSGTSNNYQVRKHTTSNTGYLQQDVAANTNITLAGLDSGTSYEILVIDKTYNKCFKFSVTVGLNASNTITRNGTTIGSSYTMNSTADLNSIPQTNGVVVSSVGYGNCNGYATGSTDTTTNGFGGTYAVSYFYGAGTELSPGTFVGYRDPCSLGFGCVGYTCDLYDGVIYANGYGGCYDAGYSVQKNCVYNGAECCD
jgi:hypothetical protein